MTTHAAQARAAAVASAVDVVVSWGKTTIAVERLGVDERFTIGAAAAADKHFVCEHASIPDARYPLVENAHDGIRVRTADGMRLFVDGEPLALTDATLARGARAVVRVGPLEICVAADHRAPTVLDRLRDVVDARLLRLSGIALTLHAGAVVMMLLASTPGVGLDAALRDFPPKWVTTAVTRPPPPLRTARNAEKQPAAAAAAAPAKRAPKSSAPPRSTKDLVADAIKALHLGDGAATPGVFGAGIDLGLSELRGRAAAAAGADGGGMGVRDLGGGGGGGGIGIGGLNGHDPRRCDGCDSLIGNAKERRRPEIRVEQPPVFSDGLSREEIQRVMNRAMNRIKFCYEKELNRDPNLDGKLAMSFVIAGDGSVATASAAQNTFAAPGGKQVASCVNHVIQGLKFPSPRGGGQVVVTYPFLFSSSG